MDHIGKILNQQHQEIEKAPAHNNSLQASKMTFPNSQEGKIIELKYKAKQVGVMNEKEINAWSKALLVKIHVITGWTIPDAELQNILVDQFKKKLIEDYSNMNPEEIEYAFRQDTQVQDWGKAMNLSLIDQVLLPYLTKRKQVSHEVEERSKPVEQKIYTEEELKEMQRLSAAQFFQRLRRGRTEKVPDDVKNILLEDNIISKPEEAESYFVQLLGKGVTAIYYEPE